MKKLLLTMLSIGALCSMPLESSAYTVDDILAAGTEGVQYVFNADGDKMTVGYTTYDVSGVMWYAHQNLALSKVNGKLHVEGFLNDQFFDDYEDNPYLNLTINDDNTATFDYGTYPWYYKGSTNYYTGCIIEDFTDQGYRWVYFLAPTNGSLKKGTGRITKDEYGRFTLTFDEKYQIVVTQWDPDYSEYNVAAIVGTNKFVIRTLAQNAEGSFTMVRHNTNGTTQAPRKVESNYGFHALKPNAQGTSKFIVDNLLTLTPPYRTYMPTNRSFASAMTQYDGELNLEQGVALINTVEYGHIFDKNGDCYLANLYGSNLRIGDNGISAEQMEGTVTVKDTPQHKNVETNYWLYPLGNGETEVDADFYFPEAHSTLIIDNAEDPQIDFSNITFTAKVPYTHECSVVNGLEYGAGSIHEGDDAHYIYLSGVVSQDKNSQFVDHYSLYLVPAALANGDIKTSNYFKHEDGHTHGNLISLEKYYTDFTAKASTRIVAAAANEMNPADKAAALNSGNNFNLLIPEDDLMNSQEDHKYALYVRAHYTPESGLEDTFHALTVLDKTTTSVEEILDGENVADITAGVGSITISGSEGNAMICTMAGMVIYQGGDATVAVAPGMYVVRAGKTAQRVIVK